MRDPDSPAIETTSGDRPRNTLAERGIVVLAALALAAGGLIALGNLLGNDKAVSKASSSPAAHGTPRPRPTGTPAPTPSPREVVLVAGTAPSAAPWEGQPWSFNGWIRALADQPLWLSADSHAPQAGVFSTGQIAYGNEQSESPGWLTIQQAGQSRYVQLAEGGTPLVEEITAAPALNSGDIWNVAAGPQGFVALVNPAALSDRQPRGFTAYSTDGANWQRGDLPSYVSAVAWGPAGWLALGTIDATDATDTTTTWVFSSRDGRTWASLGAIAGADLHYPSQLVGSERGYLLQAYDRDIQGLWFSPDGVTWVESTDPGNSTRSQRLLAAIGSGFLAWSLDAPPPAAVQFSFSADGRSWVPVQGPPTGVNLRLAALGDRVVAAVTDRQSGTVSFRTAAFHGPELVWEASSVSVPGVGVSALVSDTRHAVALLWERGTDRPVEWSSTDGRGWQPSQLPEHVFGGIPRVTAGGPKGIVAVGYRLTARGGNPIIWREVATGRWAPERSPMLPFVPDPSPTGCTPPPHDFLGFTVLDRALAAVCLGGLPLTFRAWSLPCEGCYNDAPGFDPAWLANPTTNQLFLSPISEDFGGGAQVVLSPAVTPDPAWTHHYVEVTGHFDDPAAATCHSTPAPSDDGWYSGQYWVLNGCRQQFVVTAVRLINPP